MAGVIDPVTLGVTLSTEVLFGNDIKYATRMDVVGLSKHKYLLYYANQAVDGKIRTIIGTVSYNSTNMKPSVVLSKPYVNHDSNAEFQMSADRLDDNTAIVVYTDMSTGGSLVAQIFQITKEYHASGKCAYVSVSVSGTIS